VDKERWEYHTAIPHAEVDRPGVREYLERRRAVGELVRHTPLVLIPEPDKLGAAGWELVSIQPVLAGDNEDVFIGSRGQTGGWRNASRCALRRRVG